MVTASPAARRGDGACIASALAALASARAVIRDPRWRAYAAIRLGPALARYHIPLDRNRAVIRDGVAGAICPEPVRAHAIDMLATAPVDVQLRLVDALWSGSWAGAAIGAIGAALWLRDMPRARELLAVVPDVHLRGRLDGFVRRGVLARHGKHGAWGEFVGDLRERESETAWEPSLPLVVGMIDAICADHDGARIADAVRQARSLGPRDRPIAMAHVARAIYRIAGTAAALASVRAIREASVRAGAGLLLVRAAVRADAIADARRLAAVIEPALMRQRAQLAIARHRFERREPFGALRGIDHPGLQAECWLLRFEARHAAWQRERLEALPGALARAAEPAPAWTELAPPLPLELRDAVVHCAALARLVVRIDFTVPRAWLRPLHDLASSAPARRAWLATCERIGLDPHAAIVAIRTHVGETDRSSR